MNIDGISASVGADYSFPVAETEASTPGLPQAPINIAPDLFQAEPPAAEPTVTVDTSAIFSGPSMRIGAGGGLVQTEPTSLLAESPTVLAAATAQFEEELEASAPGLIDQAASDAAAYLKANPDVQKAWDATAAAMGGSAAEKADASVAFAIMHYSKEGVQLGAQWPGATLPAVIEAGQQADAALAKNPNTPRVDGEVRKFIEWQRNQTDQFGRRIGDAWAGSGANPYKNPTALKGAAEEVDRYKRRNAVMVNAGRPPLEEAPWLKPAASYQTKPSAVSLVRSTKHDILPEIVDPKSIGQVPPGFDPNNAMMITTTVVEYDANGQGRWKVLDAVGNPLTPEKRAMLQAINEARAANEAAQIKERQAAAARPPSSNGPFVVGPQPVVGPTVGPSQAVFGPSTPATQPVVGPTVGPSTSVATRVSALERSVDEMLSTQMSKMTPAQREKAKKLMMSLARQMGKQNPAALAQLLKFKEVAQLLQG